MYHEGKLVVPKNNQGETLKPSKHIALIAAVAAACSLAACGGDKADKQDDAKDQATAAATSSAANVPTPTAADLNAVLATATDPAAPVEAKVRTVENGETAPELFETMTRSKQESHAEFVVKEPLLPGYTPNSVFATVAFTLPDRPEQTADNVEFVYLDGVWKLSQSWACTLITNTVAPEQVPAMCHDTSGAPAAPVAPAAPAAPEGSDAPAAPVASAAPAAPAAPAPAPAPGSEAPAPS